MNKLRERFTKWYVKKGYKFTYDGTDPFNPMPVYDCPKSVKPLLVLFSPSIYFKEYYK